MPESVGSTQSRIEANRRHLREHGYVTACGTWSPHINGIAVPVWSPQYQTFVVVTIGLLSAMFDEKRLHARGRAAAACSSAPPIGSLIEDAEGDFFASRLGQKAAGR